MENTDIAYLAGIIDGEGYIGLEKIGKGRTQTCRVIISVSDEELIDWIIGNFGGYKYIKSYQESSYKTQYVWRVRGDKALEILEMVLPFLKIKRRIGRASLLVNEFRACTPRNGKYTELQREKKESLIQRILAF